MEHLKVGEHVRIGVRVGQLSDTSAIAVVEGEKRALPQDPSQLPVRPKTKDYYHVRTLKELPAGTTWPAIAKELTAIVAEIKARGGRPSITADTTTAPGSIEAFRDVGAHVRPRSISSGEEKAKLVDRLNLLLQEKRLLLADTPEARDLAEDLRNYQPKAEQVRADMPNTITVGRRDALITALSLIVASPLRDKPTLVW